MQTLESNSAYNADYSERNQHNYNALAIKSPSQIQTNGAKSGQFLMPNVKRLKEAKTSFSSKQQVVKVTSLQLNPPAMQDYRTSREASRGQSESSKRGASGSGPRFTAIRMQHMRLQETN